jgi:Cof subfamily protein (haloacid dehalogenase superfamily)
MNFADLRLVASDLDGTLLRSDATLSARTVAALRAARSAGVRVVAATARPARVLADVLGAEDLLDAAICANGAVRYDPATGRHDITHPLPATVATFVMAEIERIVPGTFFAVETGALVLHEAGYAYRPSRDNERHPVPARTDLVAGPLVKVMALLPHGDPAAAWELLSPSLRSLVACTWSSGNVGADHPYPAILEIAARGVSKAAALAELCAEWSIQPAQVAAFGDARNDLEMLLWAGAGYAVANAAPEVLAATSHRAPGNDDDGVAQTLERLLAMAEP